MELKEKLALIEEALDTQEGALAPETVLDEVESWDSIAALSLIAMMDDNFGKTLSGSEIKALKTVGDILAHME
ncbi:acyl carrier protein [Acutalibacter sp.]|jgi:acyl carrier protein|uniref:acyl carrier protein n=1 Tax=Acutalibacter sp. TaxID=1918636 RepID=UPI00217376D7|nr:acyl carrier protein [Acutalibacter sp.]